MNHEKPDQALIVLAGEPPNPESIQFWASKCALIIGADRGADILKQAGIQSYIALGDFDSTQSHHQNQIVLPSQDSSDFDKALTYVGEHHLTRVHVLGAGGGSMAHTLANFSSAVKSGLNVTWTFAHEEAYLVRESIHLDLSANQKFSLIPLKPCRGVTITGARWEVHDLDFELGANLSLSNVSTGPLQISMRSGVAVLFVEHQP